MATLPKRLRLPDGQTVDLGELDDAGVRRLSGQCKAEEDIAEQLGRAWRSIHSTITSELSVRAAAEAARWVALTNAADEEG